MKGNILLVLLALTSAWVSCTDKDTPATSDTAREVSIPLAEGQAVPSGKPFPWKGKNYNFIKLAPQKAISGRSVAIPMNERKTYPVDITFKRMLGAPDKVLYLNTSNGLTPRKLSIIPDTVPAILPPPSAVAPFQHKENKMGEVEYLDMEQGLPSSHIKCIFQDSRGLTWIGTDVGLIRYDGKTFRHFEKKHGLKYAIVRSIIEDRHGNIWIGHPELEIMTKYDGHTFVHFDLSQGIKTKGILRLAEDREGNIWIGSESGVLKFDGKAFYSYRNEEGFELGCGEVFVMPDGSIRILHLNKMSLLKDDRIETYTIFSEYAPKNDQISFLAADGTIFFSQLNQLVTIRHDSVLEIHSPLFNDIGFRRVFQDSHQDVWVALDYGVARISGSVLTHFTEEDGLRKNMGFPSLEDGFGRLWFSSYYGGIHRFQKKYFQHYRFTTITNDAYHDEVSAILEDRNAHIWLGIHRGGIVQLRDSMMTIFPDFNEEQDVVRALTEDRDGNIWFAVLEKGVFKYDGSTFIPLDGGGSGLFLDIFSIAEDREGNMWFGSFSKGLLKFDGQKVTQYAQPLSRAFITKNTIRCILLDSQGTLWAGSQRAGLIRLRDGQFTYLTTHEGLSSNHIVSLFEDTQGRLWIGTDDGGVNIYEGQEFRHLGVKDGLSSNAIWTITEDRDNRIWLGANICLNVIKHMDSTGIQLAEYCNLDGLRGGEFFANASIMDSKGRIWWGNNKVLAMLSSQNIPLKMPPPQPHLSEILVAQTSINYRKLKEGKDRYTIGRSNDLDARGAHFEAVKPFHNYPLGLKLAYNINNLTFRFSASRYPYLKDIRYSYFIQGVDQEWSSPSSDQKAEYRGLNPGEYTFLLKASGRENIWSEPIEYTFSVMPPWWLTWWAYVLYALLAIVMVYGGYQVVLRRRLLEEEANRIKEIDSLRTRLYTNITHEFRTPLTVIMGMIGQIQGNEDAKGLIYRNSENLLRMINELLDLSKLEAGKLQLNLAQGDIIAYIHYLTESFHPLAKEKSITLELHPHQDSFIMDFDEEKVQHIVFNLLSNALKFTPEGGHIYLTTTTQKVGTKTIFNLSVQDNGIGISKDKLNLIFDRFYQVDDSSVRKGEGTGIGLALIKELVSLMGGDIKVYSKLGEGTVFDVAIPVTRQATMAYKGQDGLSTEKHTEEPVTSASIPATNFPDLPIALIIEDNHDVMQYVQRVLETDYTIHTARNGQVGIERAIELIPDIIVSDVMMPEKDGYEVCSILKQDERTSHIPIVLLTAKATQENKLEGLRYGADAYVTKPFHQEELKLRMEKLIEMRKVLQLYYSQVKDTAETGEEFIDNVINNGFVKKVCSIIEDELSNSAFSIPQLAEAVNMSRTQLYRKMKAITGKTPSQYIRSVRLKRGYELLQHTDKNISEIAFEVGFDDPNYFSRTFQKEYDQRPSDFRKR